MVDVLTWTRQNIAKYGGDENRIFISGHSAGGHLAALVATDTAYTERTGCRSCIKGAVLIDAFGLDMYGYLSTHPKDSGYWLPFTKDPGQWKTGSPLSHLHAGIPPMLVMVGEKTYPSIRESSNTFSAEAKKYQPDVKLITSRHRKHIGMIAQFYNPFSRAYKDVTGFIKSR